MIVAFVVTVWAAYFVPLALRRYDEAHEQSALETLSPLSRVIRRAPAVDEVADEVDEVPVEKAEPKPMRAPAPGHTRSAARLAARRRRRVLITLVFIYTTVANEVEKNFRGLMISSIFIAAILLTSIVSRICRSISKKERDPA